VGSAATGTCIAVIGPAQPVGHTQRFGAIHVRFPSQLLHMAVGSR